MLFFLTRKYLYNILKIQLLAVVHAVIHIGSRVGIHRSVKCCHFKTSKHSWKMWKYKVSILYILKKTNLITERNARSTKNLLFVKIYTYIQISIYLFSRKHFKIWIRIKLTLLFFEKIMATHNWATKLIAIT